MTASWSRLIGVIDRDEVGNRLGNICKFDKVSNPGQTQSNAWPKIDIGYERGPGGRTATSSTFPVAEELEAAPLKEPPIGWARSVESRKGLVGNPMRNLGVA